MEARYTEAGLAGERRLDVTLDARFVGQAFKIAMELPAAALPELSSAELLRRFSDAHRRIYRQDADVAARAVEIVSIRVGLHVPQANIASLGRHRHPATAGPAVLEDATATIWVPHGWTAAPDASGNLILRRRV